MPGGPDPFTGRGMSPMGLVAAPQHLAAHAGENQSQAWHLNSFRTFVMASALIILLMGLGVFLYCYQQSRRAFLDEAELQLTAATQDPSSNIPKIPARQGVIVQNPDGELSIACAPSAILLIPEFKARQSIVKAQTASQ